MILQEDIYEIATKINEYNIKNKNILITGATGLIGSLLTKGFICANKEFLAGNKIYALVRNAEKAKMIFNF